MFSKLLSGKSLLGVTFGIFLISSTFSIAISQIALGLSVCLCLILTLRGKQMFVPESLRPVSILIAIYVGWLALSSLASDTPLTSIWSLKEEWLFLAVPVAFLAFRNDRKTERMPQILAAGLCLIAIYGIIQHFTAVDWFRDVPLYVQGGLVRPSGNFSHPLTYGNYIVTGTLFVMSYFVIRFSKLATIPRLAWIFATVTCLVAISLLNSRGPMLAAIVGLFVLALLAHKLRYLLPILVGGLFIIIWLSPGLVDVFAERFETDLEPTRPQSRLYIWDKAFAIVLDNPVFGVGPGNFETAYIEQIATDPEPHLPMGHAHSDYLNIAATAGLPGLLIYLAVWLLVLKRFLAASRNLETSSRGRALAFGALVASVGFLVTSLTEATFADEEVRQLLMAIWGAGLVGVYSEQE